MSNLVNITLITLAALLFCAYIEARAAPAPISYLDDLELSYNPKTGLWRCDMMVCPANTRSCRITRQTDVNSSFIVRTNYCYNRAKISPETLQYQTYAVGPQRIDIDINSFLGVSTDLVYGYSNTSQIVNGTVRWEDWPNVQRQYRDIISEHHFGNKTFTN